jgi:hypothetical protein
MKFYLSLLMSVIFMLTSFSWAQLKLSGEVTNQKSGKTLESVNIYFPELQKGTVTVIMNLMVWQRDFFN